MEFHDQASQCEKLSQKRVCTCITLFTFITMFCGPDNIPHSIPKDFPHSVWIM